MRKEPSCTIFSSSSLSRLIRGERGRRRMGRERISPAISPPLLASKVPILLVFLLLLHQHLQQRKWCQFPGSFYSVFFFFPLLKHGSRPPPLSPRSLSVRPTMGGGGEGGEEEERPPAEKHQRREIRPPKRTSCHQGQKHMVELPAKIALSLKTRNIIFFHKRARNSFFGGFFGFLPQFRDPRHPFLLAGTTIAKGGGFVGSPPLLSPSCYYVHQKKCSLLHHLHLPPSTFSLFRRCFPLPKSQLWCPGKPGVVRDNFALSVFVHPLVNSLSERVEGMRGEGWWGWITWMG